MSLSKCSLLLVLGGGLVACGGDSKATKTSGSGGGAGSAGTVDAGGPTSSGGAAGSGAGGAPGGGGSNYLVDQIRAGAGCLPRALPTTSGGSTGAGTVPCSIVELWFPAASCSCDAARSRAPVTVDLAAAVRSRAAAVGVCDRMDGPTCDTACVCELEQAEGADLASCQNDEVVEQGIYGFCYIDEDANLGNPALVADCPATSRRRLRFVGDDTPAADAVTFLACAGLGASG